jgi:hypothetical protein
MPSLDTRFRLFGRVRAPELWPEIERREPAAPVGSPLRPRIVAGVVALLVAAAGFAFAERALSGGGRAARRPTSVPVFDRIVFSAYRDGSWDIFSVKPDGSDLGRVTDLSSTDEFAPAWSPDGSKIAFASQRAGSAADADLYVMNADGSGLARLTSSGTNWDPTWSPDGTRIAFRKSVAPDDQEIYVVGADGSGEKDLSRSPNTWELAPSWAPEGSRIAFTSVRGNDQGPQIYVMNADGTGVHELTDSAEPHDSPRWSPDGTRIAFATQRNGVWGIDVMNADGSGVERVAETPGRAASPSWSPSGTQIAYETGSVNADFAELNIVNADGSDSHPITEHRFSDLCCASWTGSRSPPSTSATPESWTPHPRPAAEISYSDPEQGFSVEYPPDWTRAEESLTPRLTDPKEILSLGTFPLRPGGHNCAQFPENAIDDLGPGDALVSIQERKNDRPSPFYQERPAHFGASDGTGHDESPYCLDHEKSFFHRWIPFTDRGRYFYAYVAMGDDVSAERKDQMWEVIDSLRFQTGPTSDPSPCDYSAVRPTYLPWIAEGTELPAPEEVPQYERLNWLGPAGSDWADAYVSVRLLSQPAEVTTREDAPPLPDGTTGDAALNSGEWDFFWTAPQTGCGPVALYVSLPHLGADEAMSEAFKIAESMSEP